LELALQPAELDDLGATLGHVVQAAAHSFAHYRHLGTETAFTTGP
jgi:hypothetical protein